VSGLVLAAFGLVMLVLVIPLQIEAGPDGMVSPRLVPNLMMVVITALSVMLVVTNLRAPESKDADASKNPISRTELIALLKIGAVFAVALLLYRFVSPLTAGAALVVGSLLALGERRPLVVLAMPAALLIGLWLLFYKVLGTAIL
jgi:Na+/H+ antiporter NhaD/arsenite permease-like protein